MHEADEAPQPDFLRKKIERYMDNNLNIASVAELSNLLNYSAAYIGALVKRLMGKSFGELLLKKRLLRSACLLTDSEYSVGEIIEIVGYKNENFFRKKFIEQYGITPLNYRRNIRRKIYDSRTKN